MEFYLHFSLTMGRSLGFGPNACNYTPYSDSLSLRLRYLSTLTSLHTFARRTVLQKVPDHTHEVLSVLVGTGFQVLFHSPPGVLFTFPSQYYTLSVTG